ncbi:growth-regulating factor 1-like [Typha latifolia]|uniref:growth-regulating factor 1-like n=1 Tax=Typha latifolia TaxID=4733 RepID=UPI003C2CBCFC
MMMMMMDVNGNGISSMYPFTESQWQELEHQALIFKYIASGIPIPSDLILYIRKSMMLDSSSTSLHLALPKHPTTLGSPVGLGCSPIAVGRKPEDPEPGRCRRTDGKKWRCSKEAYPDSKYCERHMHRGKNRSRKLVELSLATVPRSAARCLPLSEPQTHNFLRHPCSSSSPHANDYPQQHKTAHSYLETVCRDVYQLKKDTDEYPFFAETSRSEEAVSWRSSSHGISSSSEPIQKCDRMQRDRLKEINQHCFVSGSDFKPVKPEKLKIEEDSQKTKAFHHFFDEWPQSSNGRWISFGEETLRPKQYTNTQLSISIPAVLHDYSVIGNSIS